MLRVFNIRRHLKQLFPFTFYTPAMVKIPTIKFQLLPTFCMNYVPVPTRVAHVYAAIADPIPYDKRVYGLTST